MEGLAPAKPTNRETDNKQSWIGQANTKEGNNRTESKNLALTKLAGRGIMWFVMKATSFNESVSLKSM